MKSRGAIKPSSTKKKATSSSLSSLDTDRGGKRRYSAAAEKGDNAWRREWQGFISGVKMTDQGSTVKLPACMDYEQAEGSSFAYLFSSSSQRKADRSAKKQKYEAEKKREKRERELKMLLKKQERGEKVDVDWDDPFGERSKHQKAILEAQKRGLKLDGMTRKQMREFLHLSVTQAQQQALEHQREVKPHELMDEKLQWYQQGPYPLDLISEKLVIKKAVKHAKQQGLRYNFLTVHPSWIASRARKRRDAQLNSFGHRVTFDDSGEVVEKERLQALKMESAKRFALLHSDDRTATPVVEESATPADEGQGVEDNSESANSTTKKRKLKPKSSKTAAVSSTPSALSVPPPVAPMQPSGSAYRKAILSANLTTNFISNALIHGPNIGLDDAGVRAPMMPTPHTPPMGGGRATMERTSVKRSREPAADHSKKVRSSSTRSARTKQ